MVCAAFSIIMDCDEVFNYWEPMHFLTHGWGLQTWEYSPEYAIRSWAYVGLHALFTKSAEWLAKLARAQNVHLFLAMRIVFVIMSASAESKLFSQLLKKTNRTVAVLYGAFSLFSTGMFHASVSFLPSSFAMFCVTMAMASSLETTTARKRLVKAVFWIALGGLLGWPFALVVAVPFVLEYTLNTLFWSPHIGANKLGELIKTGIHCLVVTAAVLAPIVAVDSVFYKKLVVVPWNIVAYNVFQAGAETGPDIFGTEPWTYYVLNLLMNFNILFPLALLSLPLCLFYRLAVVPMAIRKFKADREQKRTPTVTKYIELKDGFQVVSGTLLWIQAPFYLWLAIFMAQPHKEERFLYVVYPSLCLNAAISVQILMSCFRPLGRVLAFGILVTTIIISALRSAALAVYYRAPLAVYAKMDSEFPGNVCVGREWYRYPSSYFLQGGQRLKFTKSGFTGLLPGEFDETPRAGWDVPGAYRVPSGMNNKNVEDPSKYISPDQCDFVVDIGSPVDKSVGEIHYTSDPEWERVYCVPFLNAGESSGIGRILWLPSPLHNIFDTRLVWDEYCLLRRKTEST